MTGHPEIDSLSPVDEPHVVRQAPAHEIPPHMQGWPLLAIAASAALMGWLIVKIFSRLWTLVQ